VRKYVKHPRALLRTIVPCKRCGKMFQKANSEIRKSSNHFCSSKCWGLSKIIKEAKTCKQCGKEFKAYSPTPRNPWLFCSRSCSTTFHSGENHPKFKGGTCHAKNGYVYISTAKNNGVFFHRYLFEEKIGRKLREGEFIHHVNGIRHDNRIENLELWDKTHPQGQRVEDKIIWAKEFLEHHGYQMQQQQVTQGQPPAI